MKVVFLGRILFFVTSILFMLAPVALAQGEREKANTLLTQALAQLGGEARLQEVRGLSVSAHSERIMRGPQEHVLTGEVELHFLLPDKFLKEATTAPRGIMLPRCVFLLAIRPVSAQMVSQLRRREIDERN